MYLNRLGPTDVFVYTGYALYIAWNAFDQFLKTSNTLAIFVHKN